MARVILTLMIKNEERIVTRCVDRALRVADAVCVCDTGSTDGTLDALGSYLPTLGVPTKLVHSPWVDFGQTRTESMRATVAFCDELGWARTRTYSLVLDADMLLRVSDAFDKTELEASAYLLRQDSGSLSHCNIRLMRLSDPWRCVGPTHEYWECIGSDTTDLRAVLETAHIDDVGDGGCKQDKFERDERLLRAALATDPTNTRHMFYLAQTLRDVGKTDLAIEWYKRRAEAGGWTQEVWYSMYQTCAMYYKLRRMPEMEYWGLKAQEYLCSDGRAECLYLLTRAFRVDAQYHKAWHYYELGRRVARPGHDALFVEPEVYSRLFEYERTILSFYVLGPAKHAESLSDIVRYMNAHGTSANTWSNMEFYVSRVPSARVRALAFPPIGPYVASSVSVLRLPDQEYLLNARYVNYRIAPDGSYYQAEGAARTRNFCVRCDADFRELGPPEEMEPDFPGTALCDEGTPQGLEDLRLYHDEDDGIGFVAASCEYSHDGTIKQVRGTYDEKARKLRSATSMRKEPGGKLCEKNWIPLGSRAGQTRFIYEWHPFTVGVCEQPDARVLVAPSTHQPTPRFFERVRGSSNLVEYDGALYTVAHLVCYTGRRRYYHIVVRLRDGPDGGPEVEAYTSPFYFIENRIEYCLGIEVRGGTLIAFVSQNDADPVVVDIPLGALDFHLLP